MVHTAVPVEASALPPTVRPWIAWVQHPRHVSVVLCVLADEFDAGDVTVTVAGAG